jgi:hypothetical protein
MSFETKVLEVATPHLAAGESAYFFNGTLFIDGVERTSRKIFSDIMMKITPMVKVSKTGPEEFAIDFV